MGVDAEQRALMATAGKTLNDASYRHVWTWNWVTFYVTRFPSHGALFLLVRSRHLYPCCCSFPDIADTGPTLVCGHDALPHSLWRLCS